MAITKTYRYTVAGIGTFPIDMLRYDQAYPDTEQDSGTIYGTLNRRERPDHGNGTVNLVGLRPPTLGRWQSFGWDAYGLREVKV